MQALILAAGRGRRFGGDTPKPLLLLQSQTLLHRMLRQLPAVGINAITVVVGYQANRIAEVLLKYKVRIVYNSIFDISDNLASFWFGTQSIYSDLLLLHGDLIVEDDLLRRILEAPGDIVLPFDRQAVDSEAMKIQVVGNMITGLSKDLSVNTASGESIPLQKFSSLALTELKKLLSSAMSRSEFGRLLESALVELLPHPNLVSRPLEVSGLKWCEIDTPQDLARAQVLFGY